MAKSPLPGVAALAAATLFPAAASADAPAQAPFIHHVYFWLNNPESAEDKAKLVAGLRKMTGIATIKSWQIGQPAGTPRDVVDNSYQVSWTVSFASAADQDAYQVDPVHLQFVKDNAALWRKVVVYDTVPAAE